MNYQYEIALSFATEDRDLVEKVYHYLKAENIHVFFAPSPEGQIVLSGKNQREVFYSIFGLNAQYVALFVSKHYVVREVPMEEARIAFAKHTIEGSVIPVYLDGTPLPAELLDPKNTNYFKSDDPAVIANHLASKIKEQDAPSPTADAPANSANSMRVEGNTAEKQVFIQTLNGNIEL